MTRHRFCYPHTVEIVDPKALRGINRFFEGGAESRAQGPDRRPVARAGRPQGERPLVARR